MSLKKKQVSVLRPCNYGGNTSARSQYARKKKILIADSDVTETARLNQFLQNHNFECILVNDVFAAVRLTKLQKPDLFIINLGISGNNGLLLMHKLKYILSAFNIPIIITNSDEKMLDKEQALHLGAELFLRIPTGNDVMLLAIMNCLSSQSINRIAHIDRLSDAA